MSAVQRGDVAIVGAGLVGSLLALVLQRRGFAVRLFERYADIRQIPSLGRSINLVITNRGLRACDAIDGALRGELLALGVAVTGRVIHQLDGAVLFQRYGRDDSECNYSISRYELNKYLIGKAEEAGVKIYFGYNLNADNSIFADGDANGGGDVGCRLSFDVVVDGIKSERIFDCHCPVIGCDGGGSRVRYSMKFQGLTDFTETLLGIESGHAHGYKEVLFPQGSGLITHGLHIWPRTSHMLMALANLDGSMTGTLYMDMDGSSNSFATLREEAAAEKFFQTYYAEALPMVGGIRQATHQLQHNPNGLLGTVRTTLWNHRGRVVLLGDAAHAIVPFFGQGMNCGFEDVLEFITLLDKHGCRGGHIGVERSAEGSSTAQSVAAMTLIDAADAGLWAAAFNEFSATRKPNTDAIADLALENFEEMRDRVSDRKFLLQKRVENGIENELGHKFRSGYAMVCYGGAGNVTYRNAFALSRVQNEILKELIAEPAAALDVIKDDSWTEQLQVLASTVSMAEAERLIDQRLTPLVRDLNVDLSCVSHH